MTERKSWEETFENEPEYARAGLVVMNAAYHALLCSAIAAFDTGDALAIQLAMRVARGLVSAQQQALACGKMAVQMVDQVLQQQQHTPEARAHLEKLRQRYADALEVIELHDGKADGHA